MQQRISLLTLGVRDLARARRFYEDGLGWIPSKQGSTDEIVFFRLNGGMVFTLYSKEALTKDIDIADDGLSSFGGITLAYNVQHRDEVPTVLIEAEQAGGRILKPAHEVYWGGYIGYFADPDGYVWEVTWNPHFPLQPNGSIGIPD